MAEVASTNKDPSVAAGYFLKVMKSIRRLPVRIRSDDGTENSFIEAVQVAIRSQHDDEYAGLGSYCVDKTDHSGGGNSLHNFPILDLLMLEIQYLENVLDIVSWIYFDNSSIISLKDETVIS